MSRDYPAASACNRRCVATAAATIEPIAVANHRRSQALCGEWPRRLLQPRRGRRTSRRRRKRPRRTSCSEAADGLLLLLLVGGDRRRRSGGGRLILPPPRLAERWSPQPAAPPARSASAARCLRRAASNPACSGAHDRPPRQFRRSHIFLRRWGGLGRCLEHGGFKGTTARCVVM